MRRSFRKLREEIRKTKSDKEKALAYYNLGLFHDNNGREMQAIPSYEKALGVGALGRIKEAEALAWLASSLLKTGKPKEALKTLYRSRQITRDQKLLKFLKGLESRIKRRQPPLF